MSKFLVSYPTHHLQNNTKLDLDVNSVEDELEPIIQSLEGIHNLSLTGNTKSPEEIVSYYLSKVSEGVIQAFHHFSEILQSHPTDLVVTIPTVRKSVLLSYRAD